MNVFLIALMLSSLFIYNLLQSVLLFLMPKSFRKKKDLLGQNVLITGAGSGLGRQLAIELSSHSTCLLLLDINKKSLLETKELLDPQATVHLYECDVINRKVVYEVAEKIKEDTGDVDIVINNAGIVFGKNFLDLEDENISKTMEVNTFAHFWVCKSFLPAMMAKNNGHLVFVSSIAGLIGSPKLSDYCASKFATIGFAEALEVEMKAKKLDGIKVTIVCPSHIDTGLFDGANLEKIGILRVEYVAKEIVAGIQEEKETIILPYYLNFMFVLKSIVPRWLTHKFHQLTGNLHAMENFRGRQNIDQTIIT